MCKPAIHFTSSSKWISMMSTFALSALHVKEICVFYVFIIRIWWNPQYNNNKNNKNSSISRLMYKKFSLFHHLYTIADDTKNIFIFLCSAKFAINCLQMFIAYSDTWFRMINRPTWEDLSVKNVEKHSSLSIIWKSIW
jgi:hypothetical protein